MKLKMYLVLTILMFGLFHSFTIEYASAETVTVTEKRIILYDNMYNSKNPAISGDYIVWQDDRNGNEDIYMYQISTGIETQVTADPDAQIYPDIHGDHIVWTNKRNGFDDDIYMFQISSGIETRITTESAIQRFPVIYGDYIVWQDDRNGNEDIYMYQISTEIETQVTTDPDDQIYPAIHGDHIVWADRRNYATSYMDIYMYEISTETETLVSDAWLSQVQPDIYGDYIVWTDNRNQATTLSDIYMYEISTETETRITTDPENQNQPAIYDDHIVWVDERHGIYKEIYMYDISTGTETRITTAPYDQNYPDIYGAIIVWEDNRHGDFDIYVGELSHDVTFSQTGVGSDFTGTVVTIDSVDYTVATLPEEFTWREGSSHTFSFASPLDTGSDNKYIWTGTSGLSTLQSDTLVITQSGSVTAEYITKYQLIEESTEQLIETIKAWNLPKGTEKSLTSKLESSFHLFSKGNENGAIHKLIDFINHVEALKGKKITNEQADQLITETQRIINLIQL